MCATRLSGSSARAFLKTTTASAMSPFLANADPRFVHARAYFGSSEMAFLNSATAPGKSPFSNVATPNQLCASAEAGPIFTAR